MSSDRRQRRGRPWAAVCLILIAVAVLSAAAQARQMVHAQLAAQRIIMPTNEVIDAEMRLGILTDLDVTELRPFAGQQLVNGAQARVYADHYVDAQLRAAAASAGVPPELATIVGLSQLQSQQVQVLKQELAALPENSKLTDQQLAVLIHQEFTNPYSQYASARNAALYSQLRADQFIPGQLVRGTLLNAYGWWLIGSIGIIAGCVLALAGTAILMTARGWHNGLQSRLQGSLRISEKDPE